VNAPLQDLRADDLLAARPDDVAALAARFRTAAGESELTAAGLSAARSDGLWRGRAAEAFRRAIGRLPFELSRVRAGYAVVAEALTRYEPELARIQSEFVQVVDQLSDADSRLGPTQASAELALAHAGGSADTYGQEIIRLTARGFALLDEFSTAREACRVSVAGAQRTAWTRPQPRQGVGAAGALSTTGGLFLGNTPAGTSASAEPPAPARARIEAMIARADALLNTPYVHGGGHGAWATGAGLDCSGFVSAVLHSGGYLNAPQTTEGFSGQPGLTHGPGRFVTIYDRTGCGANEHVIIDLNGHFFESGGGSGSGGAPFVHRFTPSSTYLASFNTILHPAGL
jgi:cell wall-associated NlpC family hydrolase